MFLKNPFIYQYADLPLFSYDCLGITTAAKYNFVGNWSMVMVKKDDMSICYCHDFENEVMRPYHAVEKLLRVILATGIKRFGHRCNVNIFL